MNIGEIYLFLSFLNQSLYYLVQEENTIISSQVSSELTEIAGIPKNWFFMIILLLIAAILFICKTKIFSRMEKIKPDTPRKTQAYDGHTCFSTIEAELDNQLYALKIPHLRPTKAKFGEFFTKSDAVPNFTIYCGWFKKDHEEIHSMIIIKNLDLPKKIKKPIYVPEVKPKYPVLEFTVSELMDKRWIIKLKKYYKPLIKSIKLKAEALEKKLNDEKIAS